MAQLSPCTSFPSFICSCCWSTRTGSLPTIGIPCTRYWRTLESCPVSLTSLVRALLDSWGQLGAYREGLTACGQGL
jgi:hypothetical protein